jgi:MFS family permease
MRRTSLARAEDKQLSEAGGFNRRVFAVGMVGFCAFLGLYATQPILPMLQAIFGASKLGVSLTVSAATLGVALAAPWVGVLADLRGRKKVIVPAIWMMGATYLLAATSGGLSTIIFWRFLQGLLTPAVFAVTVAYINEEWPRSEVGFVTSVYVAGTVLGGFTGRFLSGLVAAHFSWHWSFVVLGVLNLGMAPAISAWLPRAKTFRRSGDVRGAVRDMLGHLHNRSLLAIYAVGFTILFGLVGTFTYVTFYLAAPPFSLGPSALGALFTVYLLGAVVTPIAGKWANRLDGWKLLTGAQALSIIGILLTLVHSLPCIITGVAFCSTGVFLCQVVTNGTIGLAAGKARASAVGLYVTFYYFGGFVGATVPGFMWDLGGWPVCAIFIASVLALSLVFVLTVWRRLEKNRHRQSSLDLSEVAT